MSAFNPEAFMQQTIEHEMSTKVIPLPDDEWTGQIRKATPRQFVAKSGETYTVLDVIWGVDEEKAKKATKQEKPSAKQTIFLDVTLQGNLDYSEGKNIDLGKLREAVGQNKKSRWQPNMLVGQAAYIKTKQTARENTDIMDAVVMRVTSLTQKKAAA